ncbi:SigE family RNA polymerase sigma factor [Dactylosporangium sp. CS-047395]|uniref:SigE family RNA polymerase sigma factor n=1 Tax=Dactylosporangium sp. CS-047395 TaxID=3239936 RepID=UPI003D9178A0
MPRAETEEQEQFREYFTARHDAVRRTAYVLCGDWHWADDLTQAAFIRLATGWRTVRDRGALDAFVRTCLVRAYLSDVKRVWRRRERSVAEPPDRAGSGNSAERADGRMTFEAALRKLPPRQRAVLLCRYYQDLDVAETAATLGCSQGTVKSQAARGLAKLKELLNEQSTMLGGRR